MKVILLAGGMGTRLQSVVSNIPKPMAPSGDVPFLDILLKNLIDQGIDEVTLSVGYRHEVIMEYFGNSFQGVPINYIVEETPLGTGGALRKALQGNSEGTPYFVLNADTFIDVNLTEMLNGYLASGADVGIVLKQLDDVSRYGRVTLDSKHTEIISFEEKSGCETGFVNMGVYIIRPDFFDRFVLPNAFSLEKDCFVAMLSNISFFPWLSEGYFIDIGVPEDYERAQFEMESFCR